MKSKQNVRKTALDFSAVLFLYMTNYMLPNIDYLFIPIRFSFL